MNQPTATMTKQNLIERCASASHEVNRVYCAAIGDYSQPLWQDAPAWQRDSARDGALAILDNPDSAPSASHENWLAEKEREGWKYGPVKDPEAKTHPCCVPYAELPVFQQMKDHLFRAAVLGAADGVEVVEG